MFCPNCGTKNDDSVQKCTQCGFDQKPKGAPKPNFKGTMVFKGSPARPAAAGGAAAATSKPNLKGTMVGVAPPGIEDLRKQPEAEASAKPQPARPKPSLKGTMVGVAPPGIEDLRKQAEQAKASKSPNASAAAVGSSAAKGPPSKLKGTMIGVAPPDVSAELEAAKAKFAAQKAAKAAASPAPAPSAASETAVPPGTAAPRAAGATGKGPPSQLKGTMIGVAPPDMQAQIASARAEAEAKIEASRAKATVSEQEPPSEPDPLGGTMVGTSPFARQTPTPSQGGSANDFSEDTPPAGSRQNEESRLSSGGSDDASGAPWTDDARASGDLATAQHDLETAQHDPETAPQFTPPAGVPQQHRLPVTKSSAGPITLLLVLLLAIAGAVIYLVKGSGDEKGDDPDKSEDGAETKPAEKE